MAVKKKGLGRGLDALFPEKSVKPTEKKPEQKSVATNESLHQQEEGSLNASAVKSAAETKDTAQAAVVEEPKKSEMLVKISKVEPNRTHPRKPPCAPTLEAGAGRCKDGAGSQAT